MAGPKKRINRALSDLRKLVREIDREILRLLSERNTTTDYIGYAKILADLPVRNRELEIQFRKERARWGKKLGLDSNLIEKVFQTILTNSIQRQQKLRRKKS